MLVLPGMNGNDPASVHFPADRAAPAHALATVRDFAQAAALGEDDAARLAIIVEELVVNLLDHGDVAGTVIALTLRLEGGAVRLTLADAGRFFDPRTADPPTTVPERGGGVGLALVNAWTQIIDYAQEDGANRLDLMLPLTK